MRKLRPIRPPRMRCVVMAEYLTCRTPERAVDVLAALVAHGTSSREPGYAAALECMVATLGDPEMLSYKTRAALYAAAKQRGHHEIRRLFFDTSPARDAARSDLAAERPVIPRGRPVTLGERKSLARSHRRDLLQFLLRDPHPDVIHILLHNPHITESDVLVIASRRPASGAALTEIAANPRWGARHQVKRALVKNPSTPLVLAMRLATTLRPQDLHSIADDPQLHATLREHAIGLLRAAKPVTS